jgi:hypothetical protein
MGIVRSSPAAHPTPRTARGAALALVLGLVASIAWFPAAPAEAATSRFRMDTATAGDYVPQTNFVQCVGASIQMMLNIALPGRDRSARTQQRLQVLARAWSGSRPDGFERQGASVRGWAASLVIGGGGPYRIVGTDTLDQAMRAAATAIRETGRPVGLLVWRGRHAWVMTGFEATADPARTSTFRITRAIVMDPLYPHGSGTWGPSPRPGAAITVATLGRQFVPRRTGGRWSALPGNQRLAGKYVLVLPYGPVRAGIE